MPKIQFLWKIVNGLFFIAGHKLLYKNYKLYYSWYKYIMPITIQKVKTQYFSNARGEFSQARAEIFLASDGLYASIASTSADLVGRGLVCWSHSFSISRRQSLGTSLQRVLIAVSCLSLSDSMVPMFTQSWLTGSKIFSILGRVGVLSDVVFAAELCALPPPPSIVITII